MNEWKVRLILQDKVKDIKLIVPRFIKKKKKLICVRFFCFFFLISEWSSFSGGGYMIGVYCIPHQWHMSRILNELKLLFCIFHLKKILPFFVHLLAGLTYLYDGSFYRGHFKGSYL